MKKRTLAIIIALALMLALIVACGEASSTPKDSGRAPSEEEPKESSTPELIDVSTPEPAKPQALSRLKTIAAGHSYVVGIRTDGTVVAVGSNSDGQCNVDDWSDIISVSASCLSNTTLGLKSDGTVVFAGNGWWNDNEISDWTDIVAIYSNAGIAVGIKSDGNVVAVGSLISELSFDLSKLKNIVAVSGGIGNRDFHTGSHLVGLRSDGTVVAAGENAQLYAEWSDIIAVSGQGDFTVGLKSDGTVETISRFKISDWHDIVAIDTISSHVVFGLKSDGSVLVSGRYRGDDFYEVTQWSDIVAISASNYCVIGLKADGSILSNRDFPELNNIKIPGTAPVFNNTQQTGSGREDTQHAGNGDEINLYELWNLLAYKTWGGDFNGLDMEVVFNMSDFEVFIASSINGIGGICIVDNVTDLGDDKYMIYFSDSDRGLDSALLDLSKFTTGEIIYDGTHLYIE